MCTMICETTNLEGSAKGQSGWFKLKKVNVTYDHPFNAPWEYGINIDFVNPDIGVGSRVAVELNPQSAKDLINAITVALERGYLDPQIKNIS
ncbi:MAG: DUF6295 family protein [Dehalococcoidia bacterium]